jgi:hypothetical protein
MIKSRGVKQARHVSGMRKIRIEYKILFSKPEGKRPPGRSRRRWEDNITYKNVKVSRYMPWRRMGGEEV